jgi:GNAT superfamily N-acetyltransferase
MRIIEVSDKTSAKEFIRFPKVHYKNDPNYICPLDVEIEEIFDPARNINFNNGEACRWLLKDEESKTIGRIAAFYNSKKANLFDYPTGGAGFFECIENQEAANMLFDTAKTWLISKGMEAMEAPVNFGENYNHWGCLVKGFVPQAYAMPYNFPYYGNLFENYGFQNFFEQYCYHKDLSAGWPERMLKFAEFTQNRPNYSFGHFRYSDMDKYISDFVYSYNAIWSKYHDGYTPLENNEIRKLLEEARLVIDEELIWFAYDQGKPAGLLVVFPDINQILARLGNGKLDLINKIRFYYYRKKAITRSRAFIAGVLPEYQNTGIIAALFYQLIKVLEKRPAHTQIELSWIGDYNPKMMTIYEKIGCYRVKTHVTYMHLFDPGAKFRRFDNEFEGKLYQVRESGKDE